jgi:hypothetical protein
MFDWVGVHGYLRICAAKVNLEDMLDKTEIFIE